MKIKTADLIGPALDWAVGTALELPVEICQVFQYGRPNGAHYISIGETDNDGAEVTFEPSEEWSQGGPIIEWENLGLEKHRLDGPYQWAACDWHPVVVQGYTCLERSKYAYGPTQLIAAMRCLVAATLGDEVDVPDELV